MNRKFQITSKSFHVQWIDFIGNKSLWSKLKFTVLGLMKGIPRVWTALEYLYKRWNMKKVLFNSLPGDVLVSLILWWLKGRAAVVSILKAPKDCTVLQLSSTLKPETLYDARQAKTFYRLQCIVYVFLLLENGAEMK